MLLCHLRKKLRCHHQVMMSQLPIVFKDPKNYPWRSAVSSKIGPPLLAIFPSSLWRPPDAVANRFPCGIPCLQWLLRLPVNVLPPMKYSRPCTNELFWWRVRLMHGTACPHPINVRNCCRIVQTQHDFTIVFPPCKRLQGIECHLQLEYVDVAGTLLIRPGHPGTCFTANCAPTCWWCVGTNS